MKSIHSFLLLLLLFKPLAARAADDLTSALQKGLFEEEANQNLPAAIKAYESLLAASDEQRKLAATALFRLGECYRKLGKTNDAVAQYQRLLRDYADQSPLATLSRQNLTGLGVGQTPLPKTDQVAAAMSAEAEELARTERILVQLSGRDLGQVRRLLPTVAPDADFEQYDRLLSEAQEKARTSTGEASDQWRRREAEYTQLLERRFDQIRGLLTQRADQLLARVEKQNAEALKQQSASMPETGRENAGTAGEVRQEIGRIQELLKDSPDLVNALNIEITKTPAGPLLLASKGTLLHKTASEGQVAVAKFLIGRGANVDMRDSMSQTPLHWAAGGGHKAMVELLLTNKADVNASSSLGGSRPLHLAVRLGYRAVCEALLAGGADPNLVDGNDAGPIFYAVQKNDEPVLRLLLAKGAKVNPDPDKRAGTLLHEVGTTNIAKVLIEAGAVVDALDNINRSPLHEKASMGNRAVIDFLLAAGASPNLKDKNGKTPLHLAAAYWRANVVAPLIAKGGNPNERNAYGGVPLDELIQFSKINSQEGNRAPQLETLQAFLAGGADPNLVIVGGTPHLFRAVSEGLEEQVEALLKAGADPNARSDYDREGTINLKGQTPLIRSLRGTKRSSSGYGSERSVSMSLVNLLLEHKADVNMPDGNGDTPLYYAIMSGSRDFPERAPFVEALLRRGASIEARNSSGYTPLATAVANNMKEMVVLLLKSKADPNAMTRKGTSPLHLAASSWNSEFVEILLEAGADPNALDAEGRSALDHVKARGSTTQPGGFRAPVPPPVPNFSGQASSDPKTVAMNELADRLRKAGARDWAPRPGLITVTRRSTGVSQVIFTKGTNDWNRHSLLEVMGFTFFGSSSSFPFPDFSKLKVTRLDREQGGVREFTIDLPAALAKDGCSADQWLEWGDLIDVPEGEHRLDERWVGLRPEDRQSFAKCLSRKVSISVKAKTNTVELVAPSNWSMPVGENLASRLQAAETYWLNQTVKRSGLLLTSSDLSRVAVRRLDIQTGSSQEWTFDLTKEPSVGNDLWLRDGDAIEVPEKP